MKYQYEGPRACENCGNMARGNNLCYRCRKEMGFITKRPKVVIEKCNVDELTDGYIETLTELAEKYEANTVCVDIGRSGDLTTEMYVTVKNGKVTVKGSRVLRQEEK